MHPETFLRVLGPQPWRVAYVQPSRRPADGRYGENPNRLYKHLQLQVILKPAPADVQDLYLRSLDRPRHRPRRPRRALRGGQLGVAHARRLGHRLAGPPRRPGDHAVHVLPAGGRHRPRADLGRDHLRPRAHRACTCRTWTTSTSCAGRRTSCTARCGKEEEYELSRYSFELADTDLHRRLFDSYLAEGWRVLETPGGRSALPAYDWCLKSSHAFNVLDARGRHLREPARGDDPGHPQAGLRDRGADVRRAGAAAAAEAARG